MKKYLFTILLTIASFLVVNQAHASTYTYYRAITVTSTTSIASGTNSNFPMLVSSTLALWEPVSKGGHVQNLCTAPNGRQEPCDLVFTSDSGCSSPLNFETESYSSSTGALIDWVNVPTMQAGATIYACYGNSSIMSDQSNPALVWDSNYKGVWHMGDQTANTNMLDSTSNVHTGTLSANSSAMTVSGKIDGALHFTSGQDANVGTSTDFDIAAGDGSFTISMWYYDAYFSPDSGQTFGANGTKSFSGGCGPYAGYYFGALLGGGSSNSTTTFEWTSEYCYNYYNIADTVAMNSNTWNYIDFVISSSTSVTGTWYVNGAAAGSGSFTYPQSVAGTMPLTFPLGNYQPPNVDEFRFSKTARSPSWILTEYNNQSSPSMFYAVGSEQTAGGGQVYLNIFRRFVEMFGF